MGSSDLKKRFEFEIYWHLQRMKRKVCFLGVLEAKELESNLQGHPVSVTESSEHILLVVTAVQKGTIQK